MWRKPGIMKISRQVRCDKHKLQPAHTHHPDGKRRQKRNTKGILKIIKLGNKNGVDFSMTSSCYNPGLKKNCGFCDSCLLRKRGFEEAELIDPLGN